MMEEPLETLLRRNRNHLRSRKEDSGRTDSGVTGVIISCSGHQEVPALWPVNQPESTESVRSFGTQVRKLTDDGFRTVPGVEWVLEKGEPQNVLVVGHTDCNVIRETYETYLRGTEPSESVKRRTEPIRSLVHEAFNNGLVGAATPNDLDVHRLVEYNVESQTSLLSKRLGDGVKVVGYVHDRSGAYRDGSEDYHLVAVDRETEPESIRSLVPDDENPTVSTVL